MASGAKEEDHKRLKTFDGSDSSLYKKRRRRAELYSGAAHNIPEGEMGRQASGIPTWGSRRKPGGPSAREDHGGGRVQDGAGDPGCKVP